MSVIDFFTNPTAWGYGLTIIFVIVWLVALGVWRLRSKWLWLGVAGIILFAPVIAYIQAPLQSLIDNWLINKYGANTFSEQLLWMGLPLVLISGLVQEGAKTLPVAGYWLARGKKITPEQGLIIGAVIGAGFAIIESQWVLNSLFASGWTFSLVGKYGVTALEGLWERFFTIGLQVGLTGLVGYGFARGKGWQFYLLASFLHCLANYPVLVVYRGLIGTGWVEIIIAVISAAVFACVLWLRWWAPVDTTPALPVESDGTGDIQLDNETGTTDGGLTL